MRNLFVNPKYSRFYFICNCFFAKCKFDPTCTLCQTGIQSFRNQIGNDLEFCTISVWHSQSNSAMANISQKTNSSNKVQLTAARHFHLFSQFWSKVTLISLIVHDLKNANKPLLNIPTEFSMKKPRKTAISELIVNC